MDNIKIYKENDVYIKVVPNELWIIEELHYYFTYRVENCHFMPSYINKMWDGNIRLYNKYSGRIYYGLLHRIIEFCEDRDIQYSIEFNQNKSEFTKNDVNKFIKNLSLPSDKEQRTYQIDALLHTINNPRSLILSPTGSGKSLIIYMLINYLLGKTDNKQILILVPNINLVNQMYSDFEEYSSQNDFSVEDFCHKIYGGKDKITNKPIVISTWQSIYKLPKKYFQQFSSIIVDEVHLSEANSIQGILQKLENCPYRYGFTGTLKDTKCHRLTLEGLFGSEYKATTTKKLIDQGYLSDIEIKAIQLNHHKSKDPFKKMDYITEVEYILKNEKRNKFITTLAASNNDKNTLILFTKIAHGKKLFEMARKLTNKVFLVYGDTKPELREKIRKQMEKETNAVLIASYGTFSTGVNMKKIHNVIFASEYKSKIKVLQSIGRGLRKHSTKNKVTIYDIVDKFPRFDNYAYDHFKERYKLYIQESLNVKIIPVPF